MSHILSSINSNISSRLAGFPVPLMLANTFLVNAKSSIESLLTWIDSFYHELQAGDSSSKNAWLFVCSCVRCYVKELRKVRVQLKLLRICLLLWKEQALAFGLWCNHIAFLMNLCHTAGVNI